MYGYFYLMAIKAVPKWFNPMWITIAQISQMFLGITVSVMQVRRGGRICLGYPLLLLWWWWWFVVPWYPCNHNSLGKSLLGWFFCNVCLFKKKAYYRFTEGAEGCPAVVPSIAVASLLMYASYAYLFIEFAVRRFILAPKQLQLKRQESIQKKLPPPPPMPKLVQTASYSYIPEEDDGEDSDDDDDDKKKKKEL